MSVSVGEQGRVGSRAHGPPEAVLVEGGVENLLPGRAVHLLPWMEDLLTAETGDDTGRKAGQTQGPCCFSQGKEEGLRWSCESLGLPSARPSSSPGQRQGRGELRRGQLGEEGTFVLLCP